VYWTLFEHKGSVLLSCWWCSKSSASSSFA
jgi:hypothetical protein